MKCPFCKSRKIKFEFRSIGDNKKQKIFICKKCGKEWEGGKPFKQSSFSF